jgi:hypothetical protein
MGWRYELGSHIPRIGYPTPPMTEDCTTCQLADWRRTKAGRLHPSGEGSCSWKGWKEWKFPKAFYLVGSVGHDLRPSGGYINRRTPCTDCSLYHPIITPTSPES